MGIMDMNFESRDEFNRKPIADNIIKLLKSDDLDISPMLIDGDWGSGKTEFSLKLINLLKNNDKFSCVFIDAFKADHANDALMTIFAAILETVPEDEDKRGIIKKALPALKFGSKVIFKSGVSWLLKQDATNIVNDYDREIQKAGDALIDYTVESVLKEHIEANDNINKLKDTLRLLCKEKPILLFIDELDRCKPDFAISMLETVKHVFDIEGLKIVFIANSQQLLASINHHYGASINAHRYLEKFLKYRMSLPEYVTDDSKSISVSSKYFECLFDNDNSFWGRLANRDISPTYTIIDECIISNSLTLRNVEAFYRYLKIFHLLTEEKKLYDHKGDGLRSKGAELQVNSVIYVIGVYIFCFDGSLVQRIRAKKLDLLQLCTILGVKHFPIQSESNDWQSYKYNLSSLFFHSAHQGKGPNDNAMQIKMRLNKALAKQKAESFIQHTGKYSTEAITELLNYVIQILCFDS